MDYSNFDDIQLTLPLPFIPSSRRYQRKGSSPMTSSSESHKDEDLLSHKHHVKQRNICCKCRGLFKNSLNINGLHCDMSSQNQNNENEDKRIMQTMSQL